MLQVVGSQFHFSAEPRVVTIAQDIEIIPDEYSGFFQPRGIRFVVVQLYLQAFLQCARAYTDRIELLDTMQHGQYFVMIDVQFTVQVAVDILDADRQVAVIID